MGAIKTRHKNQKGLTMMEIMVVIFIFTLFFGVATTRFRTGTDRDLNNQVRELALLGRQLRGKARVHDRTYRLVFEFPEENRRGEPSQFQYHIEYTTQHVLIADPEAEELPMGIEASEESLHFQPDDRIPSKTLPPGMRVAQVELTSQNQVVTEGAASVHFFPNGRIEESVVHLEWGPPEEPEPRMRWTIYFRPYTGDPEILTGHVPLAQLRATQ